MIHKELIETGYQYEVYHYTGQTEFNGCQCFKNCDCVINFQPEKVDSYSVKRIGKKVKTTNHNTMDEVIKRINEFNYYI
jgi:hypothetical protein